MKVISNSHQNGKIDLESYIRYYWIQEFSKNVDGALGSSVYFTWFEGSQLNMGPIWDFDIAYGGGCVPLLTWLHRAEGIDEDHYTQRVACC